MASKWIVGNWKMNPPLREQAVALAKEVRDGVRGLSGVDVGVAPAAAHFHAVGECLKGSNVRMGAQNLGWEDAGAYTGEVSVPMLRDAGGSFAIVGHSERRQHFGEGNGNINRRLTHAVKSGLDVILCVGETAKQRDSGLTFTILDEQVRGGVLNLAPQEFAKLAIAYEPVWAIGTGKNATPEQAAEAHAHIRQYITAGYGAEVGGKLRILYGGSVTPDNAKALFSAPGVDGALIGGASLQGASFTTLARLAT